MSTAGWRVPINVKLLAILAVPVLGYLVVATTAVVQAQQAANKIRDQASVVQTAVGPISLTTSLIDERTITSLENAGLQDSLTLRIGSSAEARQATDEQLDALQSLIAGNGDARAAYQPAVDELTSGLDSLRAQIDAGQADDAAVFARYEQFIRDMMDANADAVGQVDDAELWQGAMLSELATRQKDSRALLIESLIPVSLNDAVLSDPQQTVQISQALSVYENREAAMQELATGPYARPGSVLAEALEAGDIAAIANTALETGTVDSQTLFDAASYKGGFVYDLPSGDYIHDSFRASVVEILDQKASDRSADAAQAARIHLIAGSIGLVVTAGIAFLVARSITRPLRSLTAQAIDTATHRLPETVLDIRETPLGEDVMWPEMEAISVASTDEISDVAQAFNTMQKSALDLAVEEAVLQRLITDSLVTLGKRNQTLLGRQLDFITGLERNETNPDTLANLFYLDHLAVRMRRNAESLLVLAGIDPPRTWLGPTSITDVIRAGLGEAAEYKRVRVQDVEPATVVGTATAELSHLLAELIENALHYSRHGESVEVSGHYRAFDDGPVDGYTLTVRDAGVGMSVEEIALANRRLAGVESYTTAPSKYMGHYVTGKLAARHGITVQLHANSPGRGVTATVDLPANLLTAEEPTEWARPSLPPLPTAPHLQLVETLDTEPDLPPAPPLPPPPPEAAPLPGPETEPMPVFAAEPEPEPEYEPEYEYEAELGPGYETEPGLDTGVDVAAEPDLDATAPGALGAYIVDTSGQVTSDPGSGSRSTSDSRGAGAHKARKPKPKPKPKPKKQRPLSAGRLPVPPPPTEPLIMEPLEAPDSDEGQAS